MPEVVRAGNARRATSGQAGEFYAAARLAELGWAVALLPTNSLHYDLLARWPEDGRQIAVQVKASVGGRYWGLDVSRARPQRGGSDE